jgi:hypothetical protein
MQVAYSHRKNATDRQTDMDGAIRCFSLTLEREDHLIYRKEIRFEDVDWIRMVQDRDQCQSVV